MKYKVTKAETWDEIDAAASVNTRCIRGGANNNVKARQTWEVFSVTDDCIYFIIRLIVGSTLAGYVRLLCVSASMGSQRTYVTDFVSPSLYEPVILVAQTMEGTVLVKDFSVEDNLLVAKWPRFSATWPKLDRYPYHNTPISEGMWMAVAG